MAPYFVGVKKKKMKMRDLEVEGREEIKSNKSLLLQSYTLGIYCSRNRM